MKLLKIGSSPSCNVVISSPYVSSLHAEITVLDNGEILIEDKNSTNGTFVNGHRLTSNVETPVRRGDKIEFGNVELNWAQVPVLDNPSKYKSIINIGTSHRCDINVDSQFASRYHATVFVDKSGKCFIQDNNSKNGTEINGTKIAKGKKIPFKRGSQVVAADVDVTDQLKRAIPEPHPVLKRILIGLAAACVVCGAVFGIWKLVNGSWGEKTTPPPSLADIQTSVVWVHGQYSIYAQFIDNPIDDEIWQAVYGNKVPPGHILIERETYTATAFFLDSLGRMATNRHVAVPWEEDKEKKESAWNKLASTKFNEWLPFELLNDNAIAYYNAEPNPLFEMVVRQTAKEGKGGLYASALIRQLKNAKFKLVGELDYFGVAYPNRMYDGLDELDRCSMIDYSESPEIDLALIQLNSMRTPETVKWYFRPESFNTEKPKPQAEHLTWIGYPAGLVFSKEKEVSKLRPQIRETMCSADPGKYDFNIQGEILGGASGSPLFDPKSGNLVGVVFARYINSATYGLAVQSRYLKEMYDKETK